MFSCIYASYYIYSNTNALYDIQDDGKTDKTDKIVIIENNTGSNIAPIVYNEM